MFDGVLHTSLIINLQHLSKQIIFNVMKYIKSLYNLYLPVLANLNGLV